MKINTVNVSNCENLMSISCTGYNELVYENIVAKDCNTLSNVYLNLAQIYNLDLTNDYNLSTLNINGCTNISFINLNNCINITSMYFNYSSFSK